ncbi:MAG TPA: hypothetical protein VGI60_18020 [Chthoniobacterales bacterium]
MNSRKTVRKSVALPNSRWAAYAMAGAATSLAGLASAEAEIHYSGHIDHRFTGHNHAAFPLQDGARLVFSHQLRGSNNRGFAHLAIEGTAGLSDTIGYFAGKPNNPFSGFGFYVFRLASHHAITRNSMGKSCFTTSWSSITRCVGATIQSGLGTYGEFQQPGRGFIAFSFNTGAGLQFGWARIKTSGLPFVNFILVDYAWGDPGDTIVTGQTSSSEKPQAVTKSGSLGLLATGAQGLKAWRQQRQQVVSAVTE